MKNKVRELLKEKLDVKNVYFTKRGNSSILYAFRAVKALGKMKIIIPDQAGWMTYEQFPDRLKLELIRAKTNSGLIDLKELDELLRENPESALIINSLAAYAIELPVKEIYDLCKKYDVILINDVSGSIGYPDLSSAKDCDILLGSFGLYKPVNLGGGGFIAFNDKERFYYEDIEDFEMDYETLHEKLNNLDKRLKFLKDKSKEVKKELMKLGDYDIIYPEHNGINVIVRFSDEKEKRHIIAYCDSREIPYTECPRYIRVKENAISIEIKRL
jgi:hypothetical protein